MAAIMNSSVDKMNIFLQCDYSNGSHLAKLDQSDDRKITIHLRKLVVNHNYHKKKINNRDQNQPVTTYRRDLLNPLKKAYVS